jgi:RNA polymerase sigma-70 factor (ECF subfamily)
VGYSSASQRHDDAQSESGSYLDWDEIYSDNVVRIYRMIYARVGNRPDAEDLTTEVFLAALRPLRTGALRAEVRAYLAVTAKSKLASYWRSRLAIEITSIDAAILPGASDEPPESDAHLRVRRLLDKLPERYREILELRFLDCQSIKEAAQAMGVSVANAKVLQHRALRMAGATSLDPRPEADTVDGLFPIGRTRTRYLPV